MTLLAKSIDQGGDSLYEHTMYNIKASHLISKDERFSLNELEKKSIQISAIYHDLGKINKRFQEKLLKVDKKSKELLKHEAISFIYLVELLKKYKSDCFYYASLATLNHHNRYMMIEKIKKDSNGSFNLNNFISEALSGLSQYKEEKNNINDSLFIARTEDGIDVAPINVPVKETIKIYSELDNDCDKELLKKFLEKLNNNSNAMNVEWFITSLKYVYKNHFKLRKQDKNSSLVIVKNFILIKSLFKVCDEFASFFSKKNFEQEFSDFINNSIFIKTDYSKDAKKVINGEWIPRGFQKEILEADFSNDITVLKAGVGMGKTIASELIKYKMNKKFISFHTPNRLLAFNQLAKEWDTVTDLISSRNIRNIKNMYTYYHTIDQLYLSLTGSKREYLFLKLYYGGCVVLDEIDIFQDIESIKNIYTLLELLKVMKIKTIVTTATYTKSLELFLEKVNKVDVFPKKNTDVNEIRAKFKVLKSSSLIHIIKDCYEKKRTLGIYCNTVNSCVLLKKKLDSLGIKSILYHSRLEQKIKEERKNILLNSFKREGSKEELIAIMSPITEVGVDISFEMMISEPAPVRNIEQRAGRVNRFLNVKDSIFFLLDNFLIGMYNKDFKPYNSSIAQYDPYFLNIPFLLNKYIDFYKQIDNTFIGSVDMIMSKQADVEKDEWFSGILNEDREKFSLDLSKIDLMCSLKPEDLLALPLFKFNIDSNNGCKNVIPACFRNVEVQNYNEYLSIANHMFNYGTNVLKDKYIEDPEYGIFDSKILNKV